MLLNDQQVAINQLHVAFQEATDQYGSAASGIVEDAELVAAFQALADERRQAVKQLADLTREQGLLPRAPDPDREQMQTLLTEATATLSGDARQSVLQDRLNAEAQLIEQLRQAQALELPAATRSRLQQLARDVERGIDTLTKLAG